MSSRPLLFSKSELQYDSDDDFLGSGVFGDVFRCRLPPPSGELVKVLLPLRLQDSVKREVCILLRLTACSNVVRLLGLCLDFGHNSIVMEFVENLKDLLLGDLSNHAIIKQWEFCISMAQDFASGMAFLHRLQSSIIHRDLKTSNVLVNGEYCRKIADFGLATARNISTQSQPRPATTAGSQQNPAGTLAFVAPRLFEGRVDKSDVYAYSIVLWQLKEMKTPYHAEQQPAVIRVNVTSGIRPILSNDNCPSEFKDLITRCWDLRPDARLSFRESVRKLEGMLSSFTSLHKAARSGTLETVKMLVAMSNMAVNAQTKEGWSPLHYAAHRPDKFLIKRNADVFLQTEDGCQPCHLACRVGSKSCVEALLEATNEEQQHLMIAKANNGWTPLFHAVNGLNGGHLDVVQWLVDKWAVSVDAQDYADIIPLHIANKLGVAPITEYLIDHNALVNSRTKDGYTPLHWIAFYNKSQVVDLVIRKAANLNAQNQAKNTPIHLAKIKGYMYKKINATGADLSIRNADGLTPLTVTSEIPHKIRSRGAAAIRHFRAALQHGKTKPHRVKLMLLGDARVGKSSLFRYLTGQAFIEDLASTDGIHTRLISTPEVYPVSDAKWMVEDKPQSDFRDKIARETVIRLRQEESTTSDSQSRPLIEELSPHAEAAGRDLKQEHHHEPTTQQSSQFGLQTLEQIHDFPPASDTPARQTQDAEKLEALQPDLTELPMEETRKHWEMSTQEDKGIKFSVWDFAGQSLYESTHHTFLTRRALYLIVLNLAKLTEKGITESDLQRIHLWVASVHTHTPLNPEPVRIFFIGTHRDSSKEDQVKMAIQQLCSCFQISKVSVCHIEYIQDDKILAQVENSSLDYEDKEICVLRNAILKAALDHSYMKEDIPLAWLRCEDEIMSYHQLPPLPKEGTHDPRCLWTVQEMQALAVKCNVNIGQDPFKTMITFFHDVGLIVYPGDVYVRGGQDRREELRSEKEKWIKLRRPIEWYSLTKKKEELRRKNNSLTEVKEELRRLEEKGEEAKREAKREIEMIEEKMRLIGEQEWATGYQKRDEHLTLTRSDHTEEQTTARFSRQELKYDDSHSVGDVCDHDFIGSGSFSTVYRGRLSGTDEFVAVKVVDPREDGAFKTEVAILESTKGSQYVIQLLGVCKEENYSALVLEYASSGDLDSFLSRCINSEDAGVELQYCKDWNFRCRVISQIARGVQFLHKQDILHGDLKSRNIFLDKEYNCKIGDFNLSRIAYDAMPADFSDSSKVYQTETLWFRAPELFLCTVNNSIDRKKCDSYGFGVIVYHVKEMKLPDCGEEGHSSVIRGLVKCGWRPPLTPDDSCPTVMLSLIEHCCNVLPDDRPDFNEIVKTLIRVSGSVASSGITFDAQDHSTEMSCNTLSVMEETLLLKSMTPDLYKAVHCNADNVLRRVQSDTSTEGCGSYCPRADYQGYGSVLDEVVTTAELTAHRDIRWCQADEDLTSSGIDSGSQDMSTEMYCDVLSVTDKTILATSVTPPGSHEAACNADIHPTGCSGKLLSRDCQLYTPIPSKGGNSTEWAALRDTSWCQAGERNEASDEMPYLDTPSPLLERQGKKPKEASEQWEAFGAKMSRLSFDLQKFGVGESCKMPAWHSVSSVPEKGLFLNRVASMHTGIAIASQHGSKLYTTDDLLTEWKTWFTSGDLIIANLASLNGDCYSVMKQHMSTSSKIARFDGRTGTWHPLLTFKGKMQLAANDNDLLLIGNDTGLVDDQMQIYKCDAIGGMQERICSIPISPLQFSAIAIGDKIYMTGTHGDMSSFTLSLDLGDFSVHFLPTTTNQNCTLLNYGGRVVASGGIDDSERAIAAASNHVEIFQPKYDQWLPLLPMTHKRVYHGVCVTNDYALAVVGGANLSSVEIFHL